MENNQKGFYAAVEHEQKMRSGHQGTGNLWGVRRPTALQQTSADLNNPKLQIERAIHHYFAMLGDNLPALIRFIAVPRSLAQHPVLGTNVAMNMIYRPDTVTEEEIECVLAEISQLQEHAPTLPEVAAMFVGDYLLEECTVGECYWLLKLCEWLKCALPSFVKAMESKLYIRTFNLKPHVEPELRLRNIEYQMATPRASRAGYPVYEDPQANFFNFHELIHYSDILNRELIHESTQQYKVLEQVLRRL